MSTQSPTTGHPVTLELAGTRVCGTRTFLTAGIAAGPNFVGVAALEVAFRDGFDLTRHPLSLLGLGDYGWIQIANFVVAGLLSIACAVGVRRALHPGRAGTWGPVLIGAYGVGLTMAGIFAADPSMGFPAGAPAGNSETLSWHGVLHGVGTMLAFPALTVACFIFVRHFAGLRQKAWARYSAASGLIAPALIAAPTQSGFGVRLALASVVTFAWLSVVAAQLRRSCSV